MRAPFAGYRVLDLSAQAAQLPHALAVAMAAQLAARFGAEVVRPAAEGDLLTGLPPLLPDGGSALTHFLLAGRSAAASGPFHAAIGDSGALLSAEAPLKVRVSVFAAGDDPPMSELGLMALSGILAAVQPRQGLPARLGGHQAAYAGGLAAFTALAAGLRAGLPDTADVSLFDVACWLNWKAAASVLLLGEEAAGRQQRGDWHTLPARDGDVCLVYMAKDWPALRDMVGDPRLLEPRFATQKGRGEHLAALDAILMPWFASRSRAEITAAAQARRIPVGPVLTPRELLTDRQYAARRFLAADGTPRLPLLWNGAPPEWNRGALDNAA
ncbi:CoA transferase [Roseomonas sp. F4]